MTVVVAAVAAAVVDASSAVALNTGARCIAVRISFRALAAAAVVATASFGKTANQFAFERTVVVAAAAHRYFRIGFDTYRVVTFVA